MYNDYEIEKACNTAIRNIIKEGTTDVELFNRPFEIDLLNVKDIKKEIIKNVKIQIKANRFDELRFNKIGHVLVPKKNLCDYRRCAWIDIIDEVKYLTLVLLIAKDIEKNRDNRSNKRVFSYRLKTINNNDYIFDYNYNYSAFKDRVIEKSKMRNKYIVVECDISNFYDRLNLHRLESTLLSIENIDRDIIKIINELLFFWSNRDSYGLPVGSNASRILAEASLIEVDNYLISKKIDFCRFVDDYRIFAKNAAEAHKNLAILVERLNKEGLFLNYGKTNIKELSKQLGIIKNKKTNKNGYNVDEQGVIYKIIRGYSGLIPLKFRKLSESEIKKLILENEEENIKKLKDSLLIDPVDFKKTIKILVAKEKYEKLSEISCIIDKFPQFIPYYIDTLQENCDNISEDSIDEIKNNMNAWIKNDEIPEYIQIYVIRLFATEKFKDEKIILGFFRNLKRNSGDYIGRALLESMDGNLTRGEAIEVREYYRRADIWEKREIIKILQKKLNERENRPFFKDIRLHTDDILEKSIAYTKLDKKEFKDIRNIIN